MEACRIVPGGKWPFYFPPAFLCRRSKIRCSGADHLEIGNQSSKTKRACPLPSTLDESVGQARFACRQAIKARKTRILLELPLPLIGATDLDDWPGGIQQQFKAAAPMVYSLLEGLLDGKDIAFKNYILDEGDAVGVWENNEAALILFPTAETLPTMERFADRCLLLVNVQWQDGQVVSDFGFGVQRKRSEEFIKSFETVYYLKQLRLLRQDLRLFKCFPENWKVYVTKPNGEVECIADEVDKPPYSRLQELVKQKGSRAANDWVTRLLQEFKFNRDSLQ